MNSRQWTLCPRHATIYWRFKSRNLFLGVLARILCPHPWIIITLKYLKIAQESSVSTNSLCLFYITSDLTFFPKFLLSFMHVITIVWWLLVCRALYVYAMPTALQLFVYTAIFCFLIDYDIYDRTRKKSFY